MRRFVPVLLAALASCTPPRVYKEGYEPPAERPGIAHETVPRGTLSGRAGPASGAAGIAFFATSNQMYSAFGELVAGPLAQGVQTYNLEVTSRRLSDDQERALGALQTRAARAARRTARDEGMSLVSVRFITGPKEPDGSFLLRIESVLEAPNGVRHTEVRDAAVRPRGPGEPPLLEWLGPPRDQ